MTGPHPATAAIRSAVRSALAGCSPGDVVLVALSGGADSLALAAALAVEAPALRLRAGAVIVDHALQPGSADVAARVAGQAHALGIDLVDVVPVTVAVGGDGPEASARQARYAALSAVADRHGAALVLLGHTLDDQAEQVLLGLARGSGARSLSGMPAARDRFSRPLLRVSREQTRESCQAEGLPWWDDPMNDDPAYLRVRARRALADLERDLGPGIASALARSAEQLREDADHLDAQADAALTALVSAEAGPRTPTPTPTPTVTEAAPVDPTLLDPTPQPVDRARIARETPVSRAIRAHSTGGGGVRGGGTATVVVGVRELGALPRAIRTRVWRRLLLAAGAPGGQLGSRHIEACDALLTSWHGQGPLHVPGDLRVTRSRGSITIQPASAPR